MINLKKINRILIFTLLVVAFFYFGAPFLIPFIFGALFAFLMIPLCNLLEKTGINRTISSLLSTLVVFIVFGGTLLLFVNQISNFLSDLPEMEDKIESFMVGAKDIVADITTLSPGKQDEIMQESSGQIIEKIEPYISAFFGHIFSTVVSFFLVLIYLFLLLLYRQKIFDFLMKYITKSEEDSAKETLFRISKVAFHYLWGRAQVMILLGIMFFITFILFGLPYALLFTLFGAVITIIPYLGPLLSGLLPIMFSFVYFDSMQKIIFFSCVVIVIQLIESYVLEPLIIGKEVELNPLVVIVAIVAGGIMWGLAGMILFVPIFAMVKIIALEHSGLKPIAILLGQDDKKNSKSK
jgi:predicted PurR-regulated permease PerM